MGVLEDCLEFLTMAGQGKVVLRTGSAAAPLDAGLTSLIETTVTSGDVSVFLPMDQAGAAGLRAYLRGLVDKGVDAVVALIDPGATTLVTDPEKLLAVQRDLGVALHAPVDAVAPGLLPEDRLFPVGVNGLKASADAVPASYRLLPEGQAVQRAALSDLKTSQVPASIERLRGWLTGSPARAGSWPGDHSAVAAVHHALYDTLPGGEVDKLLSSPRPVSLGTLQELLRGRLASLDPGTVWSEFSAGRAAAALIHGWPDGDANPRAFWLVRDPGDGRMYWADPLAHGELLPADLDGAHDERAAILERQKSTALLVDASGNPYVPTAGTAVEAVPLVSMHARPHGQSLLVGAWPQAARSTIRKQILDVVFGFDSPVIAVDVRRGQPLDGRSTMDGELKAALNESLKRATGAPVVVATEYNDDLMWLVRNQYGGATVVPSTGNLGGLEGWDVHGQGLPERYSVLSADVLVHAGRQASRTAVVPAPQVLREFIASPSWPEAEQYFRANRAELLTPESITAVRALVDQYHARASTLGPDGRAHEDHPFFVPDRALPAFGVLLEVASRTANDPRTEPVTPNDPSLLADRVPYTALADESLFFGYLSNRPVPGSAGGFQDGLLWLRQLIGAMFAEPITGVGPAAVVDTLAAKGELEGERAARNPGSPEFFRAHATVAAALLQTIDPVRWGGSVSPHAQITAIDCLTGEDRVAWHYIIKQEVQPIVPPPTQNELRLLIEDIATCY
ncbi:hypothetical protein [Verrucosispora sioxanthis]|uniref:Uncharacterized protein n=1 Tax=Verrucosispora sioxanthis TaxID=2499994 RepID=A0A6M1LBM8_9ACTN|nr:hypothetical protein [Verrucosispora sioxanthis]NEE66552.1 hypothetical protein [Verrucosispora sioxanthis]NGM15662.1 hypothetical protein [Verrucosispora sioxanthis]